MFRTIGAMFWGFGKGLYYMALATIAVAKFISVAISFLVNASAKGMADKDKVARRSDARRAAAESAELRRLKLTEMRRRQR